MADVFISYSKGKASNTVQQIADALDCAGFSCWYMERDSKYGTFARQITQEIFSCHVFLLVLDEKSNQSGDVHSEVGLACHRFNKHQPITILPFQIDSCTLSDDLLYYLNRFTITTANPPTKQRIQELVQQIADILGKQPPKIISSGYCGYGYAVTYTLDENGLLTINGIGNLRDYFWNDRTLSSNAPWWNERQSIFNIRIKDGITAIGQNTFCDCQYLNTVNLPSSITTIGEMAFCACKSLTSIVFPDSLTSIGEFAFAHCSSFTDITIPDSVKHIAYRSFSDCNSLTRVTLPNLTYINGDAFAGCQNLTNVNIPQSWNDLMVETLFPFATTINRHK